MNRTFNALHSTQRTHSYLFRFCDFLTDFHHCSKIRKSEHDLLAFKLRYKSNYLYRICGCEVCYYRNEKNIVNS